MSKKTLFQYAVVSHKLDGKGKVIDSEILVNPTTVLSASERSVGVVAARKLTDEQAENIENIDIIIRPF